MVFRCKRKSARWPFLLLTIRIDNMLRCCLASVNARPRLNSRGQRVLIIARHQWRSYRDKRLLRRRAEERFHRIIRRVLELESQFLFQATSVHCQQRGLSPEDAQSVIINGFVRDVVRRLPLEFAVEANRLLEINLEGSVG